MFAAAGLPSSFSRAFSDPIGRDRLVLAASVGEQAQGPREDRKIIESVYAVHDTRPFTLGPVHNPPIRSPDAVTDDLFPTPAPEGQHHRPTILGVICSLLWRSVPVPEQPRGELLRMLGSPPWPQLPCSQISGRRTRYRQTVQTQLGVV